MYNKVNALVYEAIIFFCRFYPLKKYFWIRQILEYCLDDWSAFRAEVAMAELEQQIEDLHKIWDAEQVEKQKPLYSEDAPDASEAQKLLGGSMRLRAPYEFSNKENIQEQNTTT